MNNLEKKLFDKFIKTLTVKSANTKKLFGIGFIGLVGSGKSYVAKEIGKRLGLYVDCNDKVRRFLNKEGFSGSSPVQKIVEKIGPEVGHYLYQNNISKILDADLVKHYNIAKENVEKFGGKFFIIKLVCAEDVILTRLEKREREIAKNPNSNLSRAGKEDYFKRKKMHEEISLAEIFFTIDTAIDVNPQIDELINKLKKEQVI